MALEANVVNAKTKDEVAHDIMGKFVQRSITDAATIETTRAAILAMIPQASRGEYASDDHAILAFIDDYFSSQAAGAGSTGAGENSTPASTQTNSLPSTANIDPAIQASVVKNINDSTQRRLNVSANSQIMKVLIDKPRPTELISARKAVFPKEVVATLQKYAPEPNKEGHIDPEDEVSVQNWKALIDKINNGEELDLHISDEYGTPIGVVLSKPKSGEGKSENETVEITKKELTVFLTRDAFGLVPTKESKLGAKLQVTTPRNSGANRNVSGNQITIGTPAAKLTGVKDAIKAGNYLVISEAIEGKFKDAAVTSELSFKVMSKKKRNAGTVDEKPIMRTVRARTKVQAKQLKRIDGKYIDKFGSGERDANNVPMPQTAQDMQKVTKTLQSAQLSIAQDSNIAQKLDSTAADILGELANVQKAESNAAFG